MDDWDGVATGGNGVEPAAVAAAIPEPADEPRPSEPSPSDAKPPPAELAPSEELPEGFKTELMADSAC
jgi:hypothetical protein